VHTIQNDGSGIGLIYMRVIGGGNTVPNHQSNQPTTPGATCQRKRSRQRLIPSQIPDNELDNGPEFERSPDNGSEEVEHFR
jgi:hypothetical protein